MSRTNAISCAAASHQPRKANPEPECGSGPETSLPQLQITEGARRRARIRLIPNSRGLELFHATKERISPVKRAYKYHPCSAALLGRSNISVKEATFLLFLPLPDSASFHVYLPNLLCLKPGIPPDEVSGGTSQRIRQVLLLNLE